MTALDPTSLLSQADAAIATRREMLAAGTPGPWIADPCPKELTNCLHLVGPGESARGAMNGEGQDILLIVAAVNAFAAATDHAESVLGRHRPVTPIHVKAPDWCHQCSTTAWPCPDARDALTALGIVVE